MSSGSRTSGTDGFFQTLSLPLRLADLRAQRLPLEPFFVLFGDPEYDRLLASPSKSSTGLVKSLENGESMVRAVTLSTDRAEYDPSSQLSVRYDWDDARDHSAHLLVDLVDASGVARPLELGTVREIAIQAHTLLSLSLLDLRDGSDPLRLAGGETLALKLAVSAADGVVENVVVTVTVSADPVTPVPQAAYALLRSQLIGAQTQVECVRFAWSPPATRVDLVCPDDLRTGIVRRRAVFLWTDTARAGAATGFTVQKIALTGSTHFPTPDVLEGAA